MAVAIFFLLASSAVIQAAATTLLTSTSSLPESNVVRFAVDDYSAHKTVWSNKNKLHMRSKRSASECKEEFTNYEAQVVTKHPFPAPAKESADFDTITLIWTGKNSSTRVIGLMHRHGETVSNVYHSPLHGDSYGYKRSEGLTNVTVTLIDSNPSKRDHVVAIGMRDKVYLSCVSQDSGKSFTCHSLPNTYMPAGTLLFSGDNPNMVMTIMRPATMFVDDSVLMLSTDSGASWKPVHHHVTAALFKAGSTDTIFALTQIKDSSDYGRFSLSFLGLTSNSDTQLRSVDVSNIESPSVSELKGLGKVTVTGFQYAGDFLHVVTRDEDGHKVLKVSKDHGESFTDTHLPSTASGQYINILNTDSKLIFAHVSDIADSNKGTLFTSGEDGLFYTNSLDNHISDDFYNVDSMDGVYLTTQMSADRSLKTLITMDRGGEWKSITVKGCGKADCTLQVYGKFIINLHKEHGSSTVLADRPHSSANARGLIVVQGIIGSSIPYNAGTEKYTYSDEPGVFVSGDGGYTWVQAPGLEGAFHLLIEDSGGIIQALPMNKPLTQIHFSVDEGSCWYSLPVTPTLKEFNITGLIAQPGQQSLKLGIVGYGKNGSNQITWEVIDVDFKPIMKRPCSADDLQPWVADRKCYLGKIRTFQRIRTSSWCYRGASDAVTAQVEHCACSRADYECDYGFMKDDKDNCVKDKKFNKAITYCLDNYIFTLISSGYRKIPGDECDKDAEGAVVKKLESKTHNTSKACEEGDASTYIDTELVKARLCGPSAPTPSNHGLVAAIVILTLISTALCIAFTFIYCKYSALRRYSQFGSFENAAWDVNTSNLNEGTSINTADNAGKSYSRLKESGAESDVDLIM